MSSSRRRGRSPGFPATGTPSPVTGTAPESFEVASGESQDDPAAEPDAEVIADAEVTETPSVQAEAAALAVAPAPEAPSHAEASHTEVSESAIEAAGQAEAVAETTSETVTEAVARSVETATAVAEQTAEAAVETTVQAAETVPAVVETLPRPADIVPGDVAPKPEASPKSTRTGAGFVFVPSLEPLTEINTTLLAFARGEGEAAVAHLQALSRAKSPAEAIRLQVSELQRAADASLTCFSHVLRSANRFGDGARWP